MPIATLVNATDLNAWSNCREARSLLPPKLAKNLATPGPSWAWQKSGPQADGPYRRMRAWKAALAFASSPYPTTPGTLACGWARVPSTS